MGLLLQVTLSHRWLLKYFEWLQTFAWTMASYFNHLGELGLSDANLDGNRAHLLEAGFPQVLVSLLEGYAEAISPLPNTKILSISLPHLRVIRTAIGVLLNASIGFGTTHHCRVDSSDLVS
jgi:hypothetical protein